MDTSCNQVREILQDIYDDHLDMPADVQHHVSACPDCKEYWTSLSSLGTSLLSEIDNRIEPMAPPDFEKIYQKKRNRKRNNVIPVLWGVAAVCVLSLGIAINSLLATQQKRGEYISSEVQSFVTDIFSRPILYDDMPVYLNETGESDWFETDLFSEDLSDGSYIDIRLDLFD